MDRGNNESGSPHKMGVDREDRLSELPDDILISIIFQLSFKEIVATSILSTNWRKFQSRIFSLNFCFAFKQHKFLLKQDKETEFEFSHYISSKVNHPIIDHMHAFRVHMPCLGEFFYKWLQFVLMSMKVEIMDLCIVPCKGMGLCCYKFCSKLTTNQSLLCVKDLSLSLVFLDDQDIELMLSNFVFLEHLSIDSTRVGNKKLLNPRMVGHCKLTHLNMSNVLTITSIEVRDMINLVSLRFDRLSPANYVLLDSVPNLVHFSNDDGRYKMLHDIFPKIYCIHHQLLRLELSIFPDYIERGGFTFTKLRNVKYMELKVIMPTRFGTHQLFPLIEACPSLEKLEIQFSWVTFSMPYVDTRAVDHNRVERKNVVNYNNLRKVKLSGYYGSVPEVEFVMYVINNVVALQELIVKVCDITPEIRQTAIARASHHRLHFFLPLINLVSLVII